MLYHLCHLSYIYSQRASLKTFISIQDISQGYSLRALPQPPQELKQANRLFGSPVEAPVAVPRYGESFPFLMR